MSKRNRKKYVPPTAKPLFASAFSSTGERLESDKAYVVAFKTTRPIYTVGLHKILGDLGIQVEGIAQVNVPQGKRIHFIQGTEDEGAQG